MLRRRRGRQNRGGFHNRVGAAPQAGTEVPRVRPARRGGGARPTSARRDASFSGRPPASSAPSTASGPWCRPGRARPRAGSPRRSRTRSRGSPCTCAGAPSPSSCASTGAPWAAYAPAWPPRSRRPTGGAASTACARSASTRPATRRGMNLNLPRFRLRPYAAFRAAPSRCLASNSAGLRFPSAEWILTLL